MVFVQRRVGRRPAIAFSGLEVWEIVATWKEAGESWEQLVEAYPELTETQLRAAVAYYRAYPEEIDEDLPYTTAEVGAEPVLTRPGAVTPSGYPFRRPLRARAIVPARGRARCRIPLRVPAGRRIFTGTTVR